MNNPKFGLSFRQGVIVFRLHWGVLMSGTRLLIALKRVNGGGGPVVVNFAPSDGNRIFSETINRRSL